MITQKAAGNPTAVAEAPIDENSVALLATDRLQQDGPLAMLGLSCTVWEGTLTLHGVLPTQYLKQPTQTMVLGIERVDQI